MKNTAPHMLMIVIVLMGCVFVQTPSYAEGFIATLYDVPLMNGMVEITEEGSVFDTPSGRIAEAITIARADMTKEQVLAFYQQSLPQMGWVQQKSYEYTREAQLLTINIEERTHQGQPIDLYVYFTLLPLK